MQPIPGISIAPYKNVKIFRLESPIVFTCYLNKIITNNNAGAQQIINRQNSYLKKQEIQNTKTRFKDRKNTE